MNTPSRLCELSRRLKQWTERICNPLAPPVASPEDLMSAVSLVLQANDILRTHGNESVLKEWPDKERQDKEWRDAVSIYRGQLERIREHLPRVHARLHEEKIRLEAQRARMLAAMEWAQSVSQAS